MNTGLNKYYVWQGIILEDDDTNDFIQFFSESHGVNINELKQIYTKSDYFHGKPIINTGGRSDLLIGVSVEDVTQFEEFRKQEPIFSLDEIFDTDQNFLYQEDMSVFL